MSILNAKLPTEFYTKEQVMEFVLWMYLQQKKRPDSLKGIKMPLNLEPRLSYERGDILVRYYGTICGNIDIWSEKITYSK